MAAGLVMSPRTATGAGLFSDESVDFELFINDRFHFLSDFYDSGEKKFNQDRDLNILYVNPRLAAAIGPHLQGVLELEAEMLFDFHWRIPDNLPRQNLSDCLTEHVAIDWFFKRLLGP